MRVIAKGDCQKRSSPGERVIPNHAERSKPGQKSVLAIIILPVPHWHLGSPCHALTHGPSCQDPLPWATCPLNSNRTGYEEECEKTSSTQYFWYRQTLNISPSLEASGSVQWEQALCLTLAWLVVYLCILRGTASTGKVRAGTALPSPGGTGGAPTGSGEWLLLLGVMYPTGALSSAASAAQSTCR